MTELGAPEVGEHPPPYMIFLVVFLFFLTGLLGFLICHLLKKKGYHCRTRDIDEDEEEEKIGGHEDDDEENQDTVEQILKCILENEANMEAFSQMLENHNICAYHDPRLRKDSISVPPHHHTVHSDTDHNTCHLCAQIRSKKGRRQSRTPRFKQRPGEQTVFSVGRFRVTHTDKKLYGGPTTFNSGDQLDQSQDSSEKKESGYTLRSMFKDAQPAESTNGVGPNVGKRRKSVTIFGLRRGSDPVGIKGGEGIGRENRGVKFAGTKQSLVTEESAPAGNNGIVPTSGAEPGSKAESKASQNMISVTPQNEAKTASSVNSPSAQSKKQAAASSSAAEDLAKHGPSPEPSPNLTIKPSTGRMVTSSPSSLLLPSPTWSRQTHNTTEKQTCVMDNVLKIEDTFTPLQSSTPIGPMPGSIPAFTPVIPTDQHDPYSSFPVTQTAADLSSSLDLEPGVGGSLALISSSPLSSLPVKAPSSCSLKTSSSPPAATRSPKLTNTASVKTAISEAMPGEPSIPSISFGKSLAPFQALPPSPIFSASPKLDTKSQNPSSSPADHNPRFRSLPLSPTSPLFPSSPESNRASSVTIIKASPDSKTVFSVVTMVEEEISSIQEQKLNMPDLVTKSEEAGISRALVQGEDVSALGIAQAESQREETSAAQGSLMSYQDKYDMMELEDTRNCKVMHVQEVEKPEEEVEKMEHGLSKQD